jgi:hypothetical protein
MALLNIQEHHSALDPFGEQQPDATHVSEPVSVAGFGNDDHLPPIDLRNAKGATDLLLATLRVEFPEKQSLVPSYVLRTTANIGSPPSAQSRAVTRTLPQLLALRAQLSDALPFAVLPTLPPDSRASDVRGRDHVMTFVHLLFENPVTASHPKALMLLGYGPGDVEAAVRKEFSLTASALLQGGAKTKLPSAATEPAEPVVFAVMTGELQTAVNTALGRVDDCYQHARELADRRDKAWQAAEAWGRVADTALDVREQTMYVADALRDAAPPLEAMGEALFWPWTKHIILEGAVAAASKAAFRRAASKIGGPPAAPVLLDERLATDADVIDHNLNPDVDHPTIRLRRYLQRGANLISSFADTGVTQATISPPLYRSMTVVAHERAAEAISASTAVTNAVETNGFSNLSKHRKALRDIAKAPNHASDERVNLIDADVTATWARIHNGYESFEAQTKALRHSAWKMLRGAIIETANAEKYCIKGALLIAEDLLKLVTSDPFVDDEDRPFRDPLESIEEEEAFQRAEEEASSSRHVFGPISTPPSAPLSVKPAPAAKTGAGERAAPAAAGGDGAKRVSTPPPQPLEPAPKPVRAQKRGQRREALQAAQEEDPFHAGADASPNGKEMAEVRRDPGVGNASWAGARDSDEFGCRRSH